MGCGAVRAADGRRIEGIQCVAAERFIALGEREVIVATASDGNKAFRGHGNGEDEIEAVTDSISVDKI